MSLEKYEFNKDEIKHAKKYFWDYIKHLDEIFLYRANVFLLVETIFFAGFLTTLESHYEKSNEIILVLFFITFFVNIIWIYTTYKTLYIVKENVKKKLYKKDSIFYDPLYSFARQERKSFLSSGFLLGIGLPILFIISWLAIIIIVY